MARILSRLRPFSIYRLLFPIAFCIARGSFDSVVSWLLSSCHRVGVSSTLLFCIFTFRESVELALDIPHHLESELFNVSEIIRRHGRRVGSYRGRRCRDIGDVERSRLHQSFVLLEGLLRRLPRLQVRRRVLR